MSVADQPASCIFWLKTNFEEIMLWKQLKYLKPYFEELMLFPRSPTHQIQIYNQYGQFVRKFGANILQHPRGVCVDNKGRIIVVECKVNKDKAPQRQSTTKTKQTQRQRQGRFTNAKPTQSGWLDKDEQRQEWITTNKHLNSLTATQAREKKIQRYQNTKMLKHNYIETQR